MLEALIIYLQRLNHPIRYKIGLAFTLVLICFIVNGLISIMLLFHISGTDARLGTNAIYLEQLQRYELAYKSELDIYKTMIFVTKVKYARSDFREVLNGLHDQDLNNPDSANARFKTDFYKLYSK